MKSPRSVLPLLFAVTVSFVPTQQAWAGAEMDAFCRFAIHEERSQLEDRETRVGLAESRLMAAEEIFVLVEGLWKNQAIQRISYLGYKHDRDVAKHGLDRQKRLLERQFAVVEQYTLYCAAVADEKSSAERRRALDEAYRRYHAADCATLALDVAIGEVDTAFHIEKVDSVRDLRANAVATRQDVIISMRDLEMARTRLDRATRRAEACRRAIAPAGD